MSQNFNLEHETGFEATRSDGNYENPTPSRNHNSVDVRFFNPDILGFTHVHQNPFVHPVLGQQNPPPIFSSDDVEIFLQLVLNAFDNGFPVNEIFAGVLSSTNHFQLRFTGNPLDLESIPVTSLGEGGRDLLRKFNKDSETVEVGLLNYLNALGVEGVELYELLNDGSTVKHNLNDAGTGLLPPTPCN